MKVVISSWIALTNEDFSNVFKWPIDENNYFKLQCLDKSPL
jgi:hypothetical protein